MKFLVVDNLALKMPELDKFLSKYQYDKVSYKELNNTILKKYDKIILSGGHAFSVLHPNSKYKKELDLIKRTKKPVFGICLGFQLICRAYGATMHKLEYNEKGLLEITVKSNDRLFMGLPKKFFVYENHRRTVKQVSNKLIPLAFSKDGIEAVKHIKKLIWGVQFHPEHFVKNNFGRKVLDNFLKAEF